MFFWSIKPLIHKVITQVRLTTCTKLEDKLDIHFFSNDIPIFIQFPYAMNWSCFNNIFKSTTDEMIYWQDLSPHSWLFISLILNGSEYFKLSSVKKLWSNSS